MAEKDRWEKAEILAKSVGAIAVPVVVAIVAWAWNSQKTTLDSRARMSEIAIGILAAEPNGTSGPLREWAISVLQNPTDPPYLSDEAAEALRGQSLPYAMDIAKFIDMKLRGSASAKVEFLDLSQDPQFELDGGRPADQ